MGLQQTLNAPADPIRREILNMLKKGRLSAGEISEHFSVSAPSISGHLSVLKDADLKEITIMLRENKFKVILSSVVIWIWFTKAVNGNFSKR